jgi:hypothetical protein
MGASGWGYFVSYQPDLAAALQALREQVFAEGDYYWPGEADWRPVEECRPRPQTMAELFADEGVQYSGTHSILDVDRLIGPDEPPDFGTVRPMSAAEARQLVGVERVTRAHIGVIDRDDDGRWTGRCVVLHDEHGQPEEIYFWGHSGD